MKQCCISWIHLHADGSEKCPGDANQQYEYKTIARKLKIYKLNYNNELSPAQFLLLDKSHDKVIIYKRAKLS